MNIAVTGAAGYIGQKVIRKLENNKKCNRIIGISRRAFSHNFSKLSYYQMDVRDPQLMSLFKQHDVDIIIHLAFVVNPIHNEREMHNIDIEGTKNILNIAAKLGVKKIIITSSTMVYGAWPDNPDCLSEESPLRGHRRYYYNKDKITVEQFCDQFKRDHPRVKLVVLRPCLVLGPTVDQFYSRLLNWPVLPLIGGNNPPIQFVHEDDVAQAFELFVMNGKEGTFNIVGKDTIRWADVIKIAGKRPLKLPSVVLSPLLKILWRLRLSEAPPDIMDFITYPWVACGDRAADEAGFIPQYTSKDTLIDFLAHVKK